MPKITLKSSGNFAKELKKRQKLFAKKTISASIRMPVGGEDSATDALEWILWQEFGTAGRQSSQVTEFGIPPSQHGETYPIAGKEISDITGNRKWLRWYDPDNKYSKLWHPKTDPNYAYTPFVNHPGFYPKKFIRTTLNKLRQQFGIILKRAVTDFNFDSVVLQGELVNTAKAIKEAIAKQMEAVFAFNERPDGRLEGKQPADIFRRQAFVVLNQDNAPIEKGVSVTKSKIKTKKGAKTIVKPSKKNTATKPKTNKKARFVGKKKSK